MLRPFEKIITANSYSLKYAWGDNKVNIVDCLEKTHAQYGDKLTHKDFFAMITVLTKGAHSSPLNCRHDIEIIKKLCVLYPDFMNDVKVISNLLKCMTIHTYPQTCITDITSIGYKFTETQIALLNKEGYSVFDIVDTMSYNEFLSLFNNSVFVQKMLANIHLNYDTPAGKIVIDEKIATLKNTTEKFGLNIDSTFIDTFVAKYSQQYGLGILNYSSSVLNIHIIARELGLGILSKDEFVSLLEKYPKFYASSVYFASYPNMGINIDDRNQLITNVRKILPFYDRPVTRNVVLRLMHPDVFTMFVIPDISDYDPVEDLFFILSSIYEKNIIDDVRYIIIKHFLDHGYLVYDKFLMLLISLGLTDYNQRRIDNRSNHTNTNIKPPSLLVECMNKYNMTLLQHEIDNIFTFCNVTTINALSDIKILPTKELLSLNLYKNIVSHIVNNSVFIDDETVDYSELLDSYNDGSSYTIIVQNDIVKIYESLNDRDKQIYIRIPHDGICCVSHVIRYKITLTKEYIAAILHSIKWRSIVFLLHLSQEYEYIIDFIDEQMIMMIPEVIGRLWFYNNLIINERQIFALPNKFYELQPNVENDTAELLTQPIIYDISTLIKNIKTKREDNRYNLISNDCSIRKTSPKNEPTEQTTLISTSTSIKAVKDAPLSRSISEEEIVGSGSISVDEDDYRVVNNVVVNNINTKPILLKH